MNISADDVLDFWFSDKNREHWFRASTDFDNAIRQKFLAAHEAASAGQFDDWQKQARSTLALIILLDQFTRNLYRGDARTYMNDSCACEITKKTIHKGLDQQLDGWEKSFLYLPLMHSENIEDQELSVRLSMAAGLDNTKYALHHRDIVRRFGRFPHRNTLLGRKSTPEELDYLASDEAFTG